LAKQDDLSDFWNFTPEQLAKACSSLTKESSAALNDKMRAEAGQLAVEWKEALEMPQHEFGQKERRAARIAGLGKRTIEILVKLNSVT
jgi:hypothetical protein